MSGAGTSKRSWLGFALAVQGALLAGYAAARRTRAERSAQELRSLEAVDDVVRASPVGVIGMDEDGTVTMFNPAAEAMFGYRAADAVGRELAELVVPAGLRERHREGLARCREGGDAPVLGKPLRMTAQRADGSTFPVALTITRLRGVGPSAFAGYVRDITATIACAGHPPPVLVNRGDPRSVGTPSLLLGVTADAGFAEKTVVLDDDDTLVLYTDGVLDAEGRGERFGERRLLDALRGQTSSAEEALRRVVAPLELFQEGPQRDDIAMLVVRRARESASDADAPPGVVIPLARRARG